MNYQQQYPPHFPQRPSTPPPLPEKTSHPVLWTLAVLITAVMVVAVVIAAAERGERDTADSGPTEQPRSVDENETPAPAVAPEPAPSGPDTTVSDGVYQVGVDMEPGRYKTTGPDNSSIVPNCYWARTSDDSGEFASIIANGNIQGPGSVTVNAGEFVELSGGCVWTRTGTTQ